MTAATTSRPASGRPGRPVLGAVLLAAVATASGIALTATSGWLVVRSAEGPQIMSLLTVIVAVRTFGVARPVARYLERLRSHDIALRDLAARRSATYAALVPLTPARLGRRGRAALLTGVVDDLTDATEATARVTVPVVGAAVAGALTILVVTLVSPAVAAVLVVMLLAVTALAALARRHDERAGAELLRARAESQRLTQLVATSADELRATGAERQVLVATAEADRRLGTSTARSARGRSLLGGGLLVVTGAATAATALLLASSVGAGLSAPLQGLLVLTPIALGDALSGIVDAPGARARARAAERRVVDLLAQPPAVLAVSSPDGDRPERPALPRPAGPPTLVLEAVEAGWVPGRRHLGPVDLTLAPGEHVALVGPNGCGKSTALAVLARQLDPSAGRYLVDGTDATTVPPDEVRALVAVVDDDPHVFATSLRENLLLAAPAGGPVDDDELAAALTAAGLDGWVAGLTAGLDTRLGAGGTAVSGGERARLGLARALLSRRPVILLDEPVAHLDPPTAERVVADLVGQAHGRSVMMVTHHGSGLDLMDRVVDLRHDPRQADLRQEAGAA